MTLHLYLCNLRETEVGEEGLVKVTKEQLEYDLTGSFSVRVTSSMSEQYYYLPWSLPSVCLGRRSVYLVK